jgi:predicted ABC-type transport system involved in lysophospholipase L1 biosynthesis ATPase subunit
MGTLDRPTSGQVLLDGTDLARLDDRELARTRNQHIGFVFQMHHLLPQCSALENVLVPTLVHSSAAQRRDAEARALRLLERVGLAQRTHHRPAQLSGGEQQRVAVVRALINGPGLLLADEPTGSLDEAAAEQLADLIVELNREEGVTLIVVTHTPAVAQRMGLCYDMRRGALMTAGGAS